MIKVSVMYPNSEGASFDMDYYRNSHMPMVREKLGDACKDSAIDGGLGGGTPDSPPTYIAMGHLYFDSVEDFQSSFGPHADEIMGDIPNYTNIEPVIQVSQVHS
ncbi:MAG: EthD family reductase [Proteobacteria bacterium]|nr:EthD family reductase [Pseudomonadota bacterium]TDJ32609.1 MAG: EthD family reductase [Gammaproteobacteria bacterium]